MIESPAMKMNSIRGKLQFFILVILLLLVSSFLFNYFTGVKQRRLDAQVLAQQQLLSGIFEDLENVQRLLEKYLKSGSGEDYRNFTRAYPLIQEKSFLLNEYPRTPEIRRSSTDFRYQLLSYLEEANAAVTARKSNQLLIANEHYVETIRLVLLIKNDFQSIFRVLISDMQQLNERANKTDRQNLMFNILVLVFAVVFCIAIILELIRSIARPIRRLTDAATGVTDGNWECPPVPLPADSELKILTETFNRMVATIRNQLEELSKSRLLEQQLHEEEIEKQKMHSIIKESELKALQSRINPHFLFNTLNMISKMAYLEEAEKTTSLIEAMSSMLRYNLDSFSKTVTIADELQNLEDYLHIQRLRFQDRIEFTVESDTLNSEFRLPCLTIQPLVENAIIHGMNEKLEGGEIRIQVREFEDKLLVSVRDNGDGIPYERQEQIQRVLRQEEPEDEDGIGLFNVYSRLNLFCNGNIDFKISSIPGNGTEIIFLLGSEQTE